MIFVIIPLTLAPGAIPVGVMMPGHGDDMRLEHDGWQWNIEHVGGCTPKRIRYKR